MPTKATEPKNVYQLMNELRARLAREGISKERENTFSRYKFRGIDDVYNTMAPVMAEIGLIASPSVVDREVIDRQTRKGELNIHVVLRVEITFIAADNPDSRHTITVFGEGMDVGDKATNKALSSAFKYAMLTEFTIPTEGANEDADASTPTAAAQELITAKEALDVELTIRRLNMDATGFLRWARVSSYEEIPRAKLPRIMEVLAERESELQRENAGSPPEEHVPGEEEELGF